MFEYINESVTKIEFNPEINDRRSAFSALRVLGLEDFGVVLGTMPNPKFPKLSKLLPAMADDQTQNNWTGNAGLALLKQSTAFVRAISYAFTKITGKTLDNSKILDFGCGYGRLARLMYFFADESNVYGVDPWVKSVELCRAAGLNENFLLSEYLPKNLPLDSSDFNLIYAFSVFTHLSERATLMALNVLRKYIAPDGVLVITIRPLEYWVQNMKSDTNEIKNLIEAHQKIGFAFKPHIRNMVDGDITYGDTSMTVDWVEKNASNWEVIMIDRSLNDPFQRYLFMKPV
jgi:SAM-dependent methyltransferase